MQLGLEQENLRTGKGFGAAGSFPCRLSLRLSLLQATAGPCRVQSLLLASLASGCLRAWGRLCVLILLLDWLLCPVLPLTCLHSPVCKKLPAVCLPVSGPGELMSARPPAPGRGSGQGSGSWSLGPRRGGGWQGAFGPGKKLPGSCLPVSP